MDKTFSGNERRYLRAAGACGFLGVALGAFGAHGLKQLLMHNGTRDVWETAVFYHLVHAVVLWVLAGQSPVRKGPWWSFCVGIILFSGSLYLLAATNVRWLGAITPFGGLSFLLGWGWWVVAPVPRASP